MKSKQNILVLNGNPKPESFSKALAESYASGAISSGHDVDMIHINELEFNPTLQSGYESKQAIEHDIEKFKGKLSEATHFVVVFPVWWGSVPAPLKGLLDRVFLPGFAFKYEKGDLLPKQLLKGKTARIIMSMDTPLWYYKFFYGSPATKMMKNTVLEFCGFKPVKVSQFGGVIKSSEQNRQKFIEQVYKQGVKAT